MSLDSALQRVNELTAMLAPPAAQPVATSASSGDAAAAGSQASFAAALAQAQEQGLAQIGSDPTDPSASDSSSTSDPLASMQLPMPAAAMRYSASAYGIAPTAGVDPTQGAWQWSGGAGQRMVALAQREVGVSEMPPGSNDGPRIADYRSATAGAAPGPWCAYFVSWLARQAGAPVGVDGSGIGYVPTLEQWGKQTGRYFTGQQPQPGDIAIFERNGDGVPDHTGIVESVSPTGTINTIEGNSGDRVSRHSYALTQISGFVRPG